MHDFLISLFAFLAAILLLVTVHEFGHFWVARRCGVRVLRFSIGFGSPIWRWRRARDETEYVVAALPLGGYVRMLDEREGEVAPQDQHLAFNRQGLGARAAIVAAGPLINLLFAVLIYWIVFQLGDHMLRPVVGEVLPGSVAEQAGFRADDELLEIDGRSLVSWEDVVLGLLGAAENGERIAIGVRDGSGLPETRWMATAGLGTLLESQDPLSALGIKMGPLLPATLGDLVAGDPADQAGLRPGDRVLSINGESIGSWNQLVEVIQRHPGERVAIELDRGGVPFRTQITPAIRDGESGSVGRIGVGVELPEDFYDRYRILVRYGPVESLALAADKTWQMSDLMLRMLWRMLTGEASVERNLGSVVSIGRAAGDSVELGVVSFLKFLAQISIVLGIMNLLPIPMLDGGHLLFYLAEAVRGKPLSERFQENANRIGLGMLVALISLALYLDMIRLLG